MIDTYVNDVRHEASGMPFAAGGTPVVIFIVKFAGLH